MMTEGGVTHLELRRGSLAFNLDKGLRHDPLLWWHHPRVVEAIEDFRPDVIHVVSPGDVSEIGVYIAKRMKLPLAISWHTNLHSFGAMRLERKLEWLPKRFRDGVVGFSEAQTLRSLLAFYRLGDVLYAPNDELVEMLERETRKPVFLMKRGIDTELFSPSRRTASDGFVRLGYVGRITPEKNVRLLKDLAVQLQAQTSVPFRFLIVGDGSEKQWLEQHLTSSEFPGILRGKELAEAYANMDIFTFPSHTDTFGNVVLEAFASGAPAVVTASGGPKFIVASGVSGFVAHNDDEFVAHTLRLLVDSDLRLRMGVAARLQAEGESWDSVFEKVYDGYRCGIAAHHAV